LNLKKYGIDKNHFLEKDFINKRCYLLPFAIVNSNCEEIDLYNTNCPGQASIYKPNDYLLDQKMYQYNLIKVPSFTLFDLLSIIDYEKIDYIEFIKVDIQGADLDCIRSGKNLLCDKVVYICMEDEVKYSSGNNNSLFEMDKYMNSINFKKINLKTTNYPTYLNDRYKHLYPPEDYNITCIQYN